MSLTHFRSADPSASATRASRVTIQTLQDKKSHGTPIVALTAYDYATARLVDEAGRRLHSGWGFSGHGGDGL